MFLYLLLAVGALGGVPDEPGTVVPSSESLSAAEQLNRRRLQGLSGGRGRQ